MTQPTRLPEPITIYVVTVTIWTEITVPLCAFTTEDAAERFHNAFYSALRVRNANTSDNPYAVFLTLYPWVATADIGHDVDYTEWQNVEIEAVPLFTSFI